MSAASSGVLGGVSRRRGSPSTWRLYSPPRAARRCHVGICSTRYASSHGGDHLAPEPRASHPAAAARPLPNRSRSRWSAPRARACSAWRSARTENRRRRSSTALPGGKAAHAAAGHLRAELGRLPRSAAAELSGAPRRLRERWWRCSLCAQCSALRSWRGWAVVGAVMLRRSEPSGRNTRCIP